MSKERRDCKVVEGEEQKMEMGKELEGEFIREAKWGKERDLRFYCTNTDFT